MGGVISLPGKSKVKRKMKGDNWCHFEQKAYGKIQYK